MEKFDFEVEPVKHRGPRLSPLDLVTALVLMITLAIGAYFVYVYIHPTSPLNPLVPRIPTAFVFPTATVTPLQMESTWTPTLVEITITPTLAPTITIQPETTRLSLVPPSKTPPPSPTAKVPYSVTVNYLDSTLIHPEAGCAWIGIGGTVRDANDSGVVGKILRLTGTLNGTPIQMFTASNAASNFYGDGGFEFVLGTAPVASNRLLTLQLQELDQQALAEPVYIITYNDCKKNLILVRFKGTG